MTGCSLNIIIVGGGIGGLTAALALRRQGHHVRIHESSSWLRETGAAVLIPPNASCTLKRLGIDLNVVKPAPFQNALEYSNVDEAPPKYGPNGSGAPYPWAFRGKNEKDFLLVHRVDYHEALKAACTNPDGEGLPVTVSFKTKVTDWNAVEGSITLQDGTKLQADLVVAADGVHSHAHSQILGHTVPATHGGATNIRFVLPTKDLLDDPITRPILDDGEGVFAGYRPLSRISPRVWIRRFPCRNNTLQNFGAYQATATNSQLASLHTQLDPTKPSQVSQSDLLALLRNFPPELQALAHKTPSDEPLYLWQLADRPPISTYQTGKLVLVGDAAHPMWSFQGQGAAQSVEDGAVLGTLLGRNHFMDKSQLPQCLKLYDELRVGRSSVAQLLSRNPSPEFYVAAKLSVRIRELVDARNTASPGTSKDDETEAWRFIRRLDEQYRARPGEGVGDEKLATHDDISDFFWQYDCVRDAEETLKRRGL